MTWRSKKVRTFRKKVLILAHYSANVVNMSTDTAKKIKKLLVDADLSQADIARSAKVGRSAINNVISGHGKSSRLRRCVAKALGVKVEAIWPDERPLRPRRPYLKGANKHAAI